MPVLTIDNYYQLDNYIQRKVREHFPDYETYTGTDRTDGTSKFNTLSILHVEATGDVDVSRCSLRINNLLAIAEKNGIKIPIKIFGKKVNIADSAYIKTLQAEIGRLASASKPISVFRMLEKQMDIKTVTRILSPLNVKSTEYPPALLPYLLVCSAALRSKGQVVFPSGEMSKKKEPVPA